MNQPPGSVADDAFSEARKTTAAEWFGIALVALLFAWASLGIFVWHYYLIEADPNYAAKAADGLTAFDSISNYGIPKLVALATAVLVLLRRRWAVITGIAWVGWIFFGIIVGVIRFGLDGLSGFIPDTPVLSGIIVVIMYSMWIAAACYLVALRRRGVLR